MPWGSSFSMNEINFLVLGNDNTLSDLDPLRVKHSNLMVIGVNRSYLAYPESDYLFCQDPEILLEMFKAQYTDDMIVAHNIHTTPYLVKRARLMWERKVKKLKDYKITEAQVKRVGNLVGAKKIKVHKYTGLLKTNKTIPCAIQILSEKMFPDFKCRFYIYACGLKFSLKKNHFWSGTSLVANPNFKCSNKRQLSAQKIEFIALRRKYQDNPNVEIISCSDGSKLNKFYPYEPIDLVLDKYR